MEWSMMAVVEGWKSLSDLSFSTRSISTKPDNLRLRLPPLSLLFSLLRISDTPLLSHKGVDDSQEAEITRRASRDRRQAAKEEKVFFAVPFLAIHAHHQVDFYSTTL